MFDREARSPGRLLFLTLATSFLLAGLIPASATAAPTTMVDLGQASSYGVLSGASVGNTVSAEGAPHTVVRGDLGVKANAAPTGFPPGVVTGTTNVGNTAAGEAHADAVAAYAEIAARTGGAPIADALAGKTITPGLYTTTGAASNTTTVTLDGGGDPNAVFVFQVNGALAFAAGSKVVLTNGAQASRVFWQVNGAGSVGAGAEFVGTLIAMDAVGIGNGTLVNGRAFARTGALTLDNNQIYSNPPSMTIAGGTSAYTTDSSPTISGSTDVESPATVTVTVDGQTLAATPSEGTWSVTSGLLANGTYTVVASTTDGAGNTSSATQELTVDTEPPVVTLDGGASVTTDNSTPTVSGTSDVAEGTVVRVTLGSQALNALVSSSGTWNVRSAALSDGTYTVTASVLDPAGNEGTDSQSLTIDTIPTTAPDTTAPETTIGSGPSGAIGSDSATFAFGSSEQGSTLQCKLDGGGFAACTSAKSYSELSDGEYTFSVRATDSSGNTDASPATRTFTVDTTEPELVLRGKRKQTLRRAATVFAICDETCLAMARGKLVIKRGQSVKRFKLKPKRADLAADVKTKLRPKSTRRAYRVAKRALKRDGKVIARLRVRSVDAAGNVTVQRRSVRLRP